MFIADYVLTGYGTGAIMAVPGGDERDHEFAETYGLPIIHTVQAPEGFDGGAWTGQGAVINSANDDLSLDGMEIADAKAAVITWLQQHGAGEGTTTYRLRDWLFSRQRYWGEPFPIVYDEPDQPIALPDSMLPVELPEVPDYSPKTYEPEDAGSNPEPPLARVPRVGQRRARPRRRAQDVPPRDQHDAQLGRIVLVRAALHRSAQRGPAHRSGERALLARPA